jgi:menaquinone-dependent protoporphyrinogen oxidase
MKLLVSTASRHGSTAEIGDALARVLDERGFEVDRVAPDDVLELNPYDGVVLGSAVYLGRWLKPATGLVHRLADQLSRRPVWLFSSGPTGPADAVVDPASLPDLTDVVARTGALDQRLFGGTVDIDDLGPVERLMLRAAHAPTMDVRDWDAIRRWGLTIADTLDGRSADTLLPTSGPVPIQQE